MKRSSVSGILICTTSLLLTAQTWAAKAKCPADSVSVGTVCVDTYEASVWAIPADNKALIKKVQKGKASLANLSAGGTQRGATGDDYPCDDNGNDCSTIYAVS